MYKHTCIHTRVYMGAREQSQASFLEILSSLFQTGFLIGLEFTN